MTNHEIVQYQLTACRAFVQQSIEKKRKKIVLIHGKGEGVLKGEIRQYLNGIDHALKAARTVELNKRNIESGVPLQPSKNFIKKNPEFMKRQKDL